MKMMAGTHKNPRAQSKHMCVHSSHCSVSESSLFIYLEEISCQRKKTQSHHPPTQTS